MLIIWAGIVSGVIRDNLLERYRKVQMKNYSYLICDTAPITSGPRAKMYLCNIIAPLMSHLFQENKSPFM